MKMTTDIITTNIKAKQLFGIAKECLEEIIRQRDEIDEKWLTNFIKERNEATYFRFKWPFWYKKYDIKSTKEARELLDSETKERSNGQYTIAVWWKSEMYWGTYAEALKIIKHYEYDIRNRDAVYTIPIEIYNNMASFCNPDEGNSESSESECS